MHLPDALQPLHGLFMISAFILGTTVGSFCNVCIGRWPAGESVIKPRSRCPKCLAAIAWYDNIPLISWLTLGAKCRHCGKPISMQYPIVEGLTGLLFLLVYWRFGPAPAAPIYMLFCAAMVIVTFQDFADWTIPNEITLPGIPIGIVLALAGMAWGHSSGLRVTDVFDALAGAALGGGILLALDRITVLLLKKPGMGFGDVKLLAMIGAFMGWRGALGTLVIASMVGSLVGLGMILYFKVRGQEKTSGAEPESESSAEEKPASSEEEITLEGHYLPFGPYLAMGAIIYMLIGPEIIQRYFSLLDPGLDPIMMFDDLDIVLK
jgi:leader peptidase (prepilin peptidase)/N-methyltransferase